MKYAHEHRRTIDYEIIEHNFKVTSQIDKIYANNRMTEI
jgi:hypothetical protein